jgi:hypothetical protein
MFPTHLEPLATEILPELSMNGITFESMYARPEQSLSFGLGTTQDLR